MPRKKGGPVRGGAGLGVAHARLLGAGPKQPNPQVLMLHVFPVAVAVVVVRLYPWSLSGVRIVRNEEVLEIVIEFGSPIIKQSFVLDNDLSLQKAESRIHRTSWLPDSS